MHEAPAGLQPGTRRGRRALGVGGVLYTLNTVGMIVYRVRVVYVIVSKLVSFLAYSNIVQDRHRFPLELYISMVLGSFDRPSKNS